MNVEREPLLRSANEQQPHVDLAVVDQVRAICMALPGTTEKQAWGDPSFRAHGRMYAILKFGRGTALWLAAPPGASGALVSAEPERFYRPSKHPLHDGWVVLHLEDSTAINWQEIEFLAAQAHATVAERPSQPRRKGVS